MELEADAIDGFDIADGTLQQAFANRKPNAVILHLQQRTRWLCILRWRNLLRFMRQVTMPGSGDRCVGVAVQHAAYRMATGQGVQSRFSAKA